MTVGTIAVSPENPTTNSQVTITPTIRNAESATDSAQITEVSVNGPSMLESTDNIGRLGPGSTVELPFSTVFEEAGQHRLTVYVRGTDEVGDSFVVEKPAYVTVEQRSIDVGVTASAQSMNGSTGISATVTQYGSVAIESGQVQIVRDDRVLTRTPITRYCWWGITVSNL
ncbi:CARDB domain-containing protein [Halobacterium sp. KA-6]|uniref:CARDB domain-containing protein n=1 Tax=Halobacterium sp. KA-6 TaxID=2896368 RepID=UPI003FA54D4E